MRLTFQQVKKKIEEMVPKDIDYEVDLEAASIAIITNTPEKFAGSDSLTAKIAKTIKRRVEVRPSSDILMASKDAELRIMELIPDDAGLKRIYFDGALCEVTVVCLNPGLAVGPKGSIVRAIRDETGWKVHTERASPIESATMHNIRRYRQENSDERKSLLRKFGTRIYRPQRPGTTWCRLTALGSYREVGRAMHLVTTNESKIIVDVGAKPTNNLSEVAPFFDAPELLPFENLDAIVITHAHIDHIGLLPVMYKYGYRGPVYCTPPTRDLMVLLQSDYIKVASAEGNPPPYGLGDVQEMIKHIVDVEWGKTIDIAPDIKLTMYNAGHILGSSSLHMHIGEGKHNIVFSGDIKYEKSWLYEAAAVRFPRVETLILESTYGGAKDFQPTRQEATQEMQDLIQRALSRRGKIFCPVFAVGRSQEVMIAIDQLFKSGECEPVTVWIDGMISEATAIHASHPDALNRELRKKVLKGGDENPFNSSWFKQVEGRDQRESILLDPSPCIVLATSGMMTGGPIVEYFKHWAPEPNNTLCFVGYQADGTLGRRLQKGFSEVPINDGGQTHMVPIQCDVITIDGFSGHSDRRQLMDYVKAMNPKPKTIICHHGDAHTCAEFRKDLAKTYRVRTHAPKNLETIRLI
ncbi:MAG: beta-CASP ribonuclease aCPSF1 [Candidatus Thermoplasmatota archaeon]|nr:beta-CASP ribonuclease aCPSF1 [Candidatus Thermoplasmatota archaeon]